MLAVASPGGSVTGFLLRSMRLRSLLTGRRCWAAICVGSVAVALLGQACVLDLPPVTDDTVPTSTSTDKPEPDPEPEPAQDPEPSPEPNLDPEPDGGFGGNPPVGDASSGTGGMDAGRGGAGGFGGFGGEGGSGGTAGGAGGNGSSQGCKPGERECDDECIGLDEPCCPGGCDVFDNATGRCEADECVLDECFAGYVDCDGEDANGCEGDFNFEPVVGNTLVVPRINFITPDPWFDVPLRPLSVPCAQCTQADDRIPHPDPVNAGAQPTSEIWAGFAIAWDSTSLYLRAQVYDDDMPEPPVGLEARYFDNIEFVFDGNPLSFGADDRLVFIGFDGQSLELDGNDVSSVADFDAEVSGVCYTVTGRMTTQFLFQEEEPAPLSAGGQPFQFDIAVNDWDSFDSPDMGTTQRPFQQKAHLFFRDPNPNYWYGVRTLPRLELSE